MNFVPPQFKSRSLKGLMVVLLATFLPELVYSSLGATIHLGTNVTISFSSVELGREILTRRDEFTAALTPLDRRARLQVDQDVSEKDFLAFVGRCVRAWTADETNRITSAIETVADKLARWNLPFPATIHLVRTSGEEELNNCYTRQNAIIFPAAEAARRSS